MFVLTSIFFHFLKCPIPKRRHMSRTKWFIIFIVIGYFTVILFTRTPDFFSGKIVEGKVVRITEVKRLTGKGSRSATINVPDVEYVVDGKTYVFFDNECTWPPIYEVGDEVKVIYDPESPNISYMFSLIGYWINLSEIFIAGLFIAIPLALYFAIKGVYPKV